MRGALGVHPSPLQPPRWRPSKERMFFFHDNLHKYVDCTCLIRAWNMDPRGGCSPVTGHDRDHDALILCLPSALLELALSRRRH